MINKWGVSSRQRVKSWELLADSSWLLGKGLEAWSMGEWNEQRITNREWAVFISSALLVPDICPGLQLMS
jgi:hypothetical protein